VSPSIPVGFTLRNRTSSNVNGPTLSASLAGPHGHLSADTFPLTDAEAGRIYAAALAGEAAAADAFAGHMLFQMAAMSAEDGLVMQLHPGVLRDHDRTKHTVFGPDTGFDIPVVTE